jgi:hypothetical protein
MFEPWLLSSPIHHVLRFASVVALVAASVARTDSAVGAPAPSPEGSAAGDPGPVGKEAAEAQPEEAEAGDDLGTLVVGGRVFARAQLTTRDETLVDSEGMPRERTLRALDLSLPSARLKAEYQSVFEWLSAEI